MSRLAKKGNKTGNTLSYEEYSNILKQEVFLKYSDKINGIIMNGDYDKAVRFVEEELQVKYELPLQLGSNVKKYSYNNFLIVNEKTKFKNFFTYLKEELENCNSFYFIVSFIKFSGIQLLISTLDELEKRGIKGKIVTSVYLNITDPKALSKLLEYKNLEIKIYNNSRESFHTKAYLFSREKHSSCIIGSSNLSQSALYSGEEWNVRLVKDDYLDIFDQSFTQFQKIWDSNEAVNLSTEFINKYDEFRKNNNNIETFDFRNLNQSENLFVPNKMQEDILEKLTLTKKFGNKKGLVVAATGTGKTYLAAMDIKNSEPKSVLFIAHREELINNAFNVFSKILSLNVEECGFLSGNEKTFDKKFIFSTIQSLHRNLEKFSSDSFEYIVVDEFHHSKANTYESVINYFKPDFLLGLTATPERMDGKDILELCEYNLVGEMGLREALEYDLLAPFHYFGIDDETIDYDEIPYNNGKYDEEILTDRLNILKRVDFIDNKIKKIGYDGEKIMGIAFCTNIEHAKFMERELKEKGYNTSSIVAMDNQPKRKKILDDFQNVEIEILCVVDIFNEGIDIPNVNLLLFLRPTMSSTIFIQQLGRGLRKIKGKDFVTILDFMGNHKKEYLISKAFSENKNSDKQVMIYEVKNQFSNIPGASYIELDRICQNRIISKIESYNSFNKENIINEYLDFKNGLDREITAIDFLENIELFMRIKDKFGSFYKAQKIIEKLSIKLTDIEESLLELVEKNLNLKYPYEIIIIQILVEKGVVFLSDIYDRFEFIFSENINKAIQESLVLRAMQELSEYEGIDFEDKRVIFNAKNAVFSDEFKNRLNGLIELGILNFKREISIKEFNENILVKYKKYSRIELQILLNSSAQKGSWRAGYSVSYNHICLFITLNKSLVTKEELRYDNYFHRQDIVQWISQSKTSHDSKIGQMYLNHEKMEMKVHIFIRKDPVLENGAASAFTYLGESDYHSSHGDKPMYILWKLRNKIPDHLFIDFTV